ncbi:MAG: hypothetical protein AAGD01_10995 [Acidobacteriota bacterium]
MKQVPPRVFLVLATIALLFVATPATAKKHRNQAAVVVDFGNGIVEAECVSFRRPMINGVRLLRRAGFELDIERSSFGAAICSIDSTGCDFPLEACFCQCSGGPTCVFWNFFVQGDGEWEFATVGASQERVRNGTVHGWSFGSGAEPPLLTFEEICYD